MFNLAMVWSGTTFVPNALLMTEAGDLNWVQWSVRHIGPAVVYERLAEWNVTMGRLSTTQNHFDSAHLSNNTISLCSCGSSSFKWMRAYPNLTVSISSDTGVPVEFGSACNSRLIIVVIAWSSRSDNGFPCVLSLFGALFLRSRHLRAQIGIPQDAQDVIDQDTQFHGHKGEVDPIEQWPDLPIGEKYGYQIACDFALGRRPQGDYGSANGNKRERDRERENAGCMLSQDDE